MPEPSSASRRRLAALPLGVCAILLVIVSVKTAGNRRGESAGSRTADATPASSPTATAAGQEKVALRPLPVSRSSATHEWTGEDATSPVVIEKIAHNPDEFVRLVEENDRILRRQRVYRSEPAWELVERARASGEPVRRLTLPGFDGQEVQVEVTRVDVEPSGLSGSFGGHVADRPKSLVTLAFIRGREAFTVVSPDDGVFLQGHPREPGELLVTSFDPEKYLSVPGAESLKTLPIFPAK
jgi:hypothetical protein